MDLVHRFQQYMQETLDVSVDDKVLLTVSGGRDSMLMAHLFIASGYSCVIAHCNFHLREVDADLDEQLVSVFAERNKVPFFARHFQTNAYAKQYGVSTQMAARELRYAWFEELRIQQGVDWIAVAQHQDDHIETVLLNLTRGTGLQGLQGILPKRGNIIRPLLFLSSEEITTHVKELQIPFRDDQSNFSTKYARNKVRLEIIPKFREISAEFDDIMRENIVHFQEAYDLLQSFVLPIREELFMSEDSLIRIKKSKLQPYLHRLPLLFELFKPYDFSKNVLADMREHWNGESGKIFHSPEYELLLDRDDIWLKAKAEKHFSGSAIEIQTSTSFFSFADKLFEISIGGNTSICPSENVLQLDYEKLQFPLKLRFWEEGDYFYPLGMEGKSKKVSDYFIQKKIGRYAKVTIPILINGNGDIVWIVNYRADNRYRITKSTKKVFTLVCK
ncbi:tRNA lysidine(34) synthetase TilS [Sphingobacterium sp. SGR-19]|uniref:tRNA lysidine(34) synthetase TilS n=1 Tax=Sphingobacterium sp. SGR-19 TaxID=2710886 RepID=UPI0013EB6772|nr:tRNA lysidine(34) synthetase TilS [Sphingobacterium sp. SGR-19]NGM64714.1 tRNA lysidine(34) synthetase TilS [Sphingobacterium sp. SGR-19]